MKREIYYFSGTGNSLFIAKEILKKLGKGEVIPITNFLNNEKIEVEGDQLGIIFPSYCMTVPKVVREFLGKVNIKKDTYVYVIVTHNSKPGSSGIDANKILNGRIDYYDTVLMPGNSVVIQDYTNSVEESERRLNQSKKRIVEISDNIKKLEKSFAKVGESKREIVFGKLNDFILNKFYKISNKFWTNEKCNGCGLCGKICSMKNINIENKKVEWKDNCASCLGCYHWCPQKAIELSNYTKDRVRRTNPNIEIKEIIID